MKVTCESCGSKYTIKDDKVRGKRVKIRCKGCKSPIVVDGMALSGGEQQAEPSAAAEAAEPMPSAEVPPQAVPAEPAAAAAAPAAAVSPEAGSPMRAPAAVQPSPPAAASVSDDQVWSVNLSETDSRDMSTQQIIEAWTTGLVTEDAYIYKPGFDDWQPILEVPELAKLLSRGAAAGSSAIASAPSPFGAPGSASGRAATSGRSGDLFGGLAAAGSENDPVLAAPLAPPAADSMRPTGARNESSVLFSLDALKAGFESAPAPARATSSNNDDPFGLGSSAGLAGLGGGFDQNQALLAAPPPPPKKPKKESIAPGVAEAGLDRGKLMMIAGGVLVLLIAVGGVGFALGGGTSKDESAESEKLEKESPTVREGKASQDAVKGAKAAEGETQNSDTTKEADKATAAADGEKKQGEADADAEGKDATAKQAAVGAAASKPASGGAAKETAKEADKPKEAPKQAASDDSSAPPFNKSAAISALGSAAGSAASCKIPGGPTGSGKAIVTFAPSGRVTTANVVGGKFGGTSVGGCVASRFRRARVPAFSGSPVTVSKSFTVQ